MYFVALDQWVGAIFRKILMRHVLLFISLQGKGDHLSEFLSSLGDSSTSSIIEDFDFPSSEH